MAPLGVRDVNSHPEEGDSSCDPQEENALIDPKIESASTSSEEDDPFARSDGDDAFLDVTASFDQCDLRLYLANDSGIDPLKVLEQVIKRMSQPLYRKPTKVNQKPTEETQKPPNAPNHEGLVYAFGITLDTASQRSMVKIGRTRGTLERTLETRKQEIGKCMKGRVETLTYKWCLDAIRLENLCTMI